MITKASSSHITTLCDLSRRPAARHDNVSRLLLKCRPRMFTCICFESHVSQRTLHTAIPLAREDHIPWVGEAHSKSIHPSDSGRPSDAPPCRNMRWTSGQCCVHKCTKPKEYAWQRRYVFLCIATRNHPSDSGRPSDAPPS